MRETLTRLRQAMLLEREAFVWMDFNDRATGDAFVLVLLTGVVSFAAYAGGLGSLFAVGLWDLLIRFVIASAIVWLVFAGLAWAIVRYYLQAEANIATYLRFTGFAYPTTLVGVVVAAVLSSSGLITFILSFAWFLLVVARGVEYDSGLDKQKAIGVAAGAMAALILLNAVFRFSPIG